MTGTSTGARIARNEAAFRDANERIQAAADQIGIDDPIPLICECGEPHCTEVMRLTRADYERVRKGPAMFWVVAGHEIITADGEEIARIVEERSGFTILEKIGEPGEIARQLDPRSAAAKEA